MSLLGGSYGGGAGTWYAVYEWNPPGDPGGAYNAGVTAATGGTGAVRILWGVGRSYPSLAADV